MTLIKKCRIVAVTYLLILGVTGAGCEGEDTSLARIDLLEDGTIVGRGIIGGQPTNGAEETRGVVALVSGGMCSGTLIDPEVVLTAGHCVKLSDGQGNYDYTTNPSGVRIVAGASAYGGTTIARGETIVTHPTWTGTLAEDATDMALIKLNNTITNISPFELRDFPMPEADDDAILVGYGQSGGGAWGGGSGTQRIGNTTIWSVSTGFLETGGESNTCPGDSGGPVFTEQDGNWRVAGVNSFGAGTVCDKDVGMFAVNVLSACQWLNTTMIDMVGHDLGLEHCTVCKETPIAGWGQGCGDGVGDCPAGATCIKPEGFSVGGGGFCGAPCCDLGEKDADYCYDITSGDETCGVMEDDGRAHCIIHCDNDDDCLEGTKCKNKPFESEKICIAVGTGGDADTDIDADSDSDTDSDVDADTDSDADSDVDADSDGDTDSDVDADGDADSDVDTDSDGDADTDTDADADTAEDGGSGLDELTTAGCGCHQTGRSIAIPARFLFDFVLRALAF
ncbi:MAG: trypsin-like serine protease [Deltaproteobacteria bacterium]|nr:trypsin-like serine protease [Deltaproteobacteria bacterium]